MPTERTRNGKARSRTFSATDRDFEMLDAIARYHGISKSAMVIGLIRKEFWRAFPNGTDTIQRGGGGITANPRSRTRPASLRHHEIALEVPPDHINGSLEDEFIHVCQF